MGRFGPRPELSQSTGIALVTYQVVSYTVAVEVIMGTTKIIVSMYFDRELQIEHDLRKMEEVINHAKGTGVLFAADSNARSPHGMTS